MNPNEDYTVYIESATNGQRGSGDHLRVLEVRLH